MSALPLKILIIEDTKERQEILKDLTKHHAWMLVHTAKRAIRLLGAFDFDLIFPDYDLAGDGSGDQVAECIRNSRNGQSRVIIHSMNAAEANRIAGILPPAVIIPISKIVRDNRTFKRFREALNQGVDIDWGFVFRREKCAY